MIIDPPIRTSSDPSRSVNAEAGQSSRASGDCRTCALRSHCISYGWMSPGGVWFENAVVLRPPKGCRGFVGRSADIESHFRISLD